MNPFISIEGIVKEFHSKFRWYVLDDIPHVDQIERLLDATCFVSKFWQDTVYSIPEVELLVVMVGKALLIDFYHIVDNV